MATCLTMLMSVLQDASAAGNMLNHPGVVAACVQAAETEHAARIQAAAARQAGWFPLAAGLFALAAGAMGFLAAREAGRLAYVASQAQLIEAQQRRISRQAAYAGRISAVASTALQELSKLLAEFHAARLGRPTANTFKVPTPSVDALLSLLHPKEWERHSILSVDSVHALANSYETLQAALGLLDVYHNSDSPLVTETTVDVAIEVAATRLGVVINLLSLQSFTPYGEFLRCHGRKDASY